MNLNDNNIPIVGKKKRPAKIAVAMATHDMVPSAFMYDMATLCATTAASLPEGVEFGIQMVSGTYVHAARQELLLAMLQQRVTHILWVDTDMRFPKDALFRLMDHNVPIVGINYSQRGLPPDYVAIKRTSIKEGDKGEKLATTDESTGLEEVDAIGLGLCLMRADAFANLPDLDQKAWFDFTYLKERRIFEGEDVRFCRLLREGGQKIYVDHDLSKECAHVGQFEYKLSHVSSWKEAEA